jgi:hypothetical protein
MLAYERFCAEVTEWDIFSLPYLTWLLWLPSLLWLPGESPGNSEVAGAICKDQRSNSGQSARIVNAKFTSPKLF